MLTTDIKFDEDTYTLVRVELIKLTKKEYIKAVRTGYKVMHGIKVNEAETIMREGGIARKFVKDDPYALFCIGSVTPEDVYRAWDKEALSNEFIKKLGVLRSSEN